MPLRHIDVLQSLQFPTTCIDLKLTPDCLTSVGTYKPCLKIHNLNHLALKNERNIENEPLKVCPLTDCASKLAILRNDRYVELHAKYGFHTSIRMPTYCNDITYCPSKSEILCLGTSSVYRFDLDQGRFMKPLLANDAQCFNLSQTNGLLVVGCEDKTLFYDYRSKNLVHEMEGCGTTAVALHENGINFCMGTEQGNVRFFDLRMKEYLYNIKLNGNVRGIRTNGEYIYIMEQDVLSFYKKDTKVDEIHEKNLNAFDFDGGLFFIASENENIKSFYSEELGSAPRWCSYIQGTNN